MCGRYALQWEALDSGLQGMIARMNHVDREQIAQGDVHPGDDALCVRMQAGAPSLTRMRWGMPLPENGRLVINARSESAAEKGMFSDLIRENRCLLPATLYYEWTRSAAHTRMKIRSGEAMYMAGLYRRSMEAASEWEFVVLTRDAVGDPAQVHDRMPLILPDRESRRAWLRDTEMARALLQNPPEAQCSVQADEPEQLDLFEQLEI